MLENIQQHPALVMWYGALYTFIITVFVILGAALRANKEGGDFRNAFVKHLWKAGVMFPIFIVIVCLVGAIMMELGYY